MDNVLQFKQKPQSRLIVDSDTGKVKATPPNPTDFDDRLVRIRQSLEKINKLMDELKKGPPNEND